MLRLIPIALLSACSLVLPELPDAQDAGAVVADAGAVDGGETNSDAGTTPDAGTLPPCGENLQRHADSGACVPLRGEGASCIAPDQHAWAAEAQRIVYVSSEGGGDGSQGSATDLASAIETANGSEGSTAIAMAGGDYVLTNGLTITGDVRIIGGCASEVSIAGAADGLFHAQEGAAVRLYGLTITGDEAANPDPAAITISGATTVALDQLQLSAPGGDLLWVRNVPSLTMRGLTIGAVAGHALHGTDVLGTWTIECNLIPGPVGDDAFNLTGADEGQTAVTISDNRFGEIAGVAMEIGNPLATWTIECNLIPGPVGGDALRINGRGSEAQMTVRENEFGIIAGNGIDAISPFGTWTIECNLMPGPMGGTAIAIEGGGGQLTVHDNRVTAAATGLAFTGLGGSVTISSNRIESDNPAGAPSGGITINSPGADTTITMTGNIMRGLNGVAATINASAATATMSANQFRDTQDARGGAAVTGGVGLLILDSTNLTVTGNSYTGNALGGVLLDFANWGQNPDRDDLTGRPSVTIDEEAEAFANNGDGDDNLSRQNLPEEHDVDTDINGEGAGDGGVVDTPDEEAQPIERPAPPRVVGCGNGEVDAAAGEECDHGPSNGLGTCSASCRRQAGWHGMVAAARRHCAFFAPDSGEQPDAVDLLCLGHSESATLFPGGPLPRQGFQGPVLVGLNFVPRSVAVGRDHTCVLGEGGQVSCFGDNTFRQAGIARDLIATATPVNIGMPAKQVVAAKYHSCVLTDDGQVHCWGSHDGGALGDGDGTVQVPTPVMQRDGSPFRVHRLWTGPQNSCALVGEEAPLRPESNLVCWGNNVHGIAGPNWLGSTWSPPTARDTLVIEPVIDLAIGHHHACAVGVSGRLHCWGNNAEPGGDDLPVDEVLSPNPTSIALPQGVLARRVFIGAEVDPADSHLTCITTQTEAVYCAGSARDRLDGAPRLNGFTLIEDFRASALAIGSHSLCAQSAQGSRCSGADTFLASDPHAHNPPLPITFAPDVQGQPRIVRFALGGGFGLAVDENNNPFRWGKLPGQPDPVSHLEPIPEQIPGVGTAIEVAAADRAYCVRWFNDEVSCQGQLGGANFSLNQIISLPGGESNAGLTCGSEHCCIDRASTVHCWGNCDNGRCNPDAEPYSNAVPAGAPVARDLINPNAILGLGLGDEHTCASLSSGPIRCWGNSMSYRHGADEQHQNPVALDAVGAFNVGPFISTGRATTCVLDGNTPKCWGANPLGVGGQNPDLNPVLQTATAITDGPNAMHIATNGVSTCLVTVNLAILCLGDNADGVVNPGDNTPYHATPAPMVLAGGPPIVGLGDRFACGFDLAGDLRCWGYGAQGRMARGLPTTELPDPG